MADQAPNDIGWKCEVGLLDKASSLQHPVCTLMIQGNVMGEPPLGGLSQILLSLEIALLNQLPFVVKLGGERVPGDIL